MTAETYIRLKKQLTEETYSPASMVEAVEFRRNAYGLNTNQMAVLLGITIHQYSEFLYGNHSLSIESRRRAGVIGVPLSVLLAQPVEAEKPEPQLVYQVQYPGGWHDVHKKIYDAVEPSARRVMLMEVPATDVAEYEKAVDPFVAVRKAEPGLPAGVYVREKHWPPESVLGEATFHKKLVALGIADRIQGYVMGAYRDTLSDVMFPFIDDKDNRRLTPGTREHAEWLADKIVNEGYFNAQAAELLRKWPEYEEVGAIALDGCFIKKQGIPRVDDRTVYTKKA